MSWELWKFVRDLTTFIKLIEKHEISIDKSKLYDLEKKLTGSKKYYVETRDIAIHIYKKIADTKPPGITKMSIFFSHTCEFNEATDIKLNDPVKANYYFYFQINGYGNNVSKKEYINCWRLDQDIISAASKYTHPYYHFQAGGRELDYKDTGELILLAAPRLPHPPMDLFLGIHFILNNYMSTKDYPELKKMFDSYEYQEIIKRAQERMWVPYFNSFFAGNTNLDYSFLKVFPLYLQ